MRFWLELYNDHPVIGICSEVLGTQDVRMAVLCSMCAYGHISNRHTSQMADIVLLGGDLNMHPDDLGNRLLRSLTGLRDSFIEAESYEARHSVNLIHTMCWWSCRGAEYNINIILQLKILF